MSTSQAQLYAFTNAIQPVRRAWLQAAAVAAADSGITLSVATLIIHLSRMGGGVQQNVLAEEVGVNPGALLRTLDQAEAAGLIERRSVAGNRRARAVHLLPQGQKIADKLEEDLAVLRQFLLQDIAQDQIESATQIMRLFEKRIMDHLKANR